MKNNQRFVWYGILFVVGIALVISGSLGFGPIDGYIAGFGGALAGVSALKLVKAVRYARDPDYAQKLEVESSDERNVFLSTKAAELAFRLSVVIFCVASIALVATGRDATAMFTMLMVVSIMTAAYFVSYLIVRRKY